LAQVSDVKYDTVKSWDVCLMCV